MVTRVLRIVPQKIYRRDLTIPVRVKWCGKSAPRLERSGWQGKPHVEQDQIGEEERPAPFRLPGRLLELISNGQPRRMATILPPGRTQKPAYRPAGGETTLARIHLASSDQF